MCEIFFKTAPDPFNGRVEITKSQTGEFFADQLLELRNTEAFPGFMYPDLSKVPVGIDIEITPLDHVQIGIDDELA